VSLGGTIAQALALQQLDLVDRFVLLATSCGGREYLELTRDLWKRTVALRGLPPDDMKLEKGMDHDARRKND
jgi:pimeloyl-ACP methyl ester carboxylesterase